MKCEEALELISGRIDGENTPEEDRLLQEHLDTCEDCRNILQAYMELDHGVAALTEEPPADFAAGVMAAIEKETASKKQKNRWLPLLAAAAAVALVIGLGTSGLPTPANQEVAPMTTRTMAADAAAYSQTADAETIALERQANVVVTYEMLSELEDCREEMLPDGSVLYELPAAEAAEDLSLEYGLELVAVENAAMSYALLVP